MTARGVALAAAVVLAVAVPVATIGSVVLDDGSDVALLLAALVLATVVAAGWVAAAPADGAAGAVAGVGIAQAVSVALQLAQDDAVRWGAVAANLVLAAALGAAGGWLRASRATQAGPA